MQLISFDFFLFFIFAMIFLLSIPLKKKRWALLGFNVIFYLFSGISGFLIFFFYTALTYWLGILLQHHKQKTILVLSLILSLCPLLFYKYHQFLLIDILHLPLNIGHHNFIAPLGISFFTFQAVGYLLDVYRGSIAAERNYFNYYIFLSFFPCISSGPINNADSLLPQIQAYDEHHFSREDATGGARYILLGILLKVCVAGTLGKISPISLDNSFVLLLASIGYTVQIFSDFCGYSFIAYGLAQMLGFTVLQNFDRPYASYSIGEFWHRWHISLSSWLRKNIYIPLGGSRCSPIRIAINTLITFLISGIWHGANFTFVVWGLCNGGLILIERWIGWNKKPTSTPQRFLRRLYTLTAVNTLWILFAAPSLTYAFESIRGIVLHTIPDMLSIRSVSAVMNIIRALGMSTSEFIRAGAGIGIYVFYCLFIGRNRKPIDYFASRSIVVRWLKYLLIIFLILIFGVIGEEGAFIYANF